jgi:hypothetical protein
MNAITLLAGHNQGPALGDALITPVPDLTLAERLDPALVTDQLALDHAALLARSEALMGGYIRFMLKHSTLVHVRPDALPTEPAANTIVIAGGPDLVSTALMWDGREWVALNRAQLIARVGPTVTVLDETVAGMATSFVKQLKDGRKPIEAARKAEKTLYDAASDAVQAFFTARMLVPLAAAAKMIEEGPMTRYVRAKAAKEQALLNEAAATARAVADAALAAAAQSEHTDVLENAVAAAASSDKATVAAAAPVADQARTRGAMGGVAVALVVWDYEITDETLIPLAYRPIDRAAILRDVRTEKAATAIPGVRAFSDVKAGVR